MLSLRLPSCEISEAEQRQAEPLLESKALKESLNTSRGDSIGGTLPRHDYLYNAMKWPFTVLGSAWLQQEPILGG